MTKEEEQLTEAEEKEFQSLLKFVLKHEGGYTNNKNDRGGETNFGITQTTYQAYQDKQCAKHKIASPKQYKSVKNISQAEVASIYRSEYYIKYNCHKIKDQNTRFQYFDMAVNHAPKTLGKICQRAVNVPQDGIVGKQTLAAINSGNQIEIQNKMTQYRREHFQNQAKNNPKQQVFLKGWLNRVDKVENIMNSGTFNQLSNTQTPFQGQKTVGGINLDVNIESLQNIKGINQFSSKFIQDNKQNILLSDLATVLRVYTDPKIPDIYKTIQFSLDPVIVSNQTEMRDQEKVVWPDKTLQRNIIMDTELVKILFECDYLMKLMSLGVSQDGIRPFSFPQELINRGLKPTWEFERSNSKREQLCRFWLVPDVCTYSYQYGKYIIEDIKVVCQSRQMERVNNKLEDKVCQDPYDSNYQFAQKFTELYDVIAKYYPVFNRLKQVFKAVALGKWMFENRIKVDHQLLFKYLKQQRNHPYKIPIIKYEKIVDSQETPIYFTYQEKIQEAQNWLQRNGHQQTRDNINQIVNQLDQKGVQVQQQRYQVTGGIDPNCKRYIEARPVSSQKCRTYDDLVNQSTDDEADIPFIQTIECKICQRKIESNLVAVNSTLCSIHHDQTCYLCLQLIKKQDNYQCQKINGTQQMLHSECLVECQRQYYGEDY